MESKVNPYFEKPPGHATIRWVNDQGTPQHKAWLKEWRQSLLTPEQQEANAKYAEKLKAEPAKAGEPEMLSAATARLFRTMNKRAATPDLPADQVYRAARSLLWTGYKAQVNFETGNDPDMTGRESLLTAMHQMAHWLAGNEPEDETGLCSCQSGRVRLIPTRKSLYLWGSLGTGKSTLALAASYVSRQLAGDYNTGLRLDYTSLDEMIVSVYSKQNLEPVEKASKGSMVLDEMRTEHINYKHFGNDVRILSDILVIRHHAWKQSGAQTVITSNIPPKELVKSLADERLSDRMMQQYESILINGSSLRKVPVAATKEMSHG